MLKRHKKKGSFGKKGVFGKKYEEKKYELDVDIVFCIPGREFSDKWCAAWDNLASSLAANKIKYVASRAYSPIVYAARNMCLGGNNLDKKYQELFNGKVNYKYIVWVDSDNIPTVEGLQKLINSGKDIIGGVYKMQDNINYATVINMDDKYYRKHGHYEFITDESGKALLEKKENIIPVDYTGTGFLVVKKGVFEKIGYPWFKPEFFDVPGTDISDFMGEDQAFCMQAKRLGFQTYVDLGVRVGHEKKYIV